MTVYARNRSVSQYEFFSRAIDIRIEVNRLMCQETAVPKRYRLTNGVPTIETARSIVYNINKANGFYPSSAANVQERKKYLTLAIADCEELVLDLECMMRMGLPIKASRLEGIVDSLEREIALLKGARKNVRLTGKRSVAERIQDLSYQLKSLEEIQ